MWNLAFLLDLPYIRHLRRKCELILIMSMLTLVIIECLFHNYFASQSRLMFYVLCRDIQPNRSRLFRFML
jgi:hypothetical protein